MGEILKVIWKSNYMLFINLRFIFLNLVGIYIGI